MSDCSSIKAFNSFLDQMLHFTAKDYVNGTPYISATDYCKDYQSYESCCRLLDEVGTKLGVSRKNLSIHHSAYERFFFRIHSMHARLGQESWRLRVPANNAAPGAFSEFGLGKELYIVDKSFQVSDEGIYQYNPKTDGWDLISKTVVYPTAVIYDQQEQTEKIRLTYEWMGKWVTLTAKRSDLQSKAFVRKLVDKGIQLIYSKAGSLCEYFDSVIFNNRNGSIVEEYVVNRMGWITQEPGRIDFVPYSRIYQYMDETSPVYKTIKSSRGSLDKWKNLISRFRDDDHIPARIILAASFASALVGLLDNAQNFAVDIWGGKSGAGKSTGLMVAASVWANPDMNAGFITKCNHTMLELENHAASCGNLPLCLDETQTIENRKAFDRWIYNLCSGESHRGVTPYGKSRKAKTWRNCILLTGEQPITTSKSLAGAVNRVIEVESPDVFLWDNSVEMKDFISELMENYGMAGRAFVDELCKTKGYELAKETYRQYLQNATSKEYESAALILTADTLVGKWIFKDNIKLTIDDILPFIKNNEAIDTNERAHAMIIDWITVNSDKFANKDHRWGKYSKHKGRASCDVIKSELERFLDSNGFSMDSYLTWADKNHKIFVEKDGHRTSGIRFTLPNGDSIRPECVCVYYEADGLLSNDN